MSVLYVGNSYRITVSFTTWDDDTQTSSAKDPDTITYTEYVDSVSVANIVSTGIPTANGIATYYYDYNPTTTGNYFIVFDATFTGSDDEQVTYEFEIVEDGTSSSKTSVFDTLIEDEILEVSSGVDPLYSNPENLSKMFPEASLIEISEYMNFASLEVLEILDTNSTDTTFADLPFVAIEYVEASAACQLSKIYEDGGNEMSVRLGDLSVSNPNAGGASRYINRGNANSPCQMAAALRKELLQESTKFGPNRGPKAFRRSDRHANPMPDRTILYKGEARQDLSELNWNRKLRSLDD
jgi:hypothetical protein